MDLVALGAASQGPGRVAAIAAAGLIALAGAFSALALVRARRGFDAAGVVIAAVALVALVADLAVGLRPTGTAVVRDDLTRAQVQDVAALRLQGDGLRAAAWQDLPTRALQTAPAGLARDAAITLDFPRRLALGRPFELTLRRSPPLPRWRMQLLDENGKLLAQAAADPAGRAATLRWLPPVAEAMVLQARVLDADGHVLDQGPVPLQVHTRAPLQVQGRFGAPSFDTQALNGLLVGSDALVDWQVTLGKTVSRQETARRALAAPDLLVIDAAWFEHAAASARAALLTQVARGLPLLVLGANATDPAIWARELQLPLVATSGDVTRPLGPEVPWALPVTAWAPPSGARARLGPWERDDRAAPWLAQRAWQAGRIGWLSVSDWHRMAIGAPLPLGAWWQTVLDQLGVRRAALPDWDFPDALPVAGERTRVCARGARDTSIALVVELSGLNQQLQLQRRADNADAACAAFWPRQAGWQRVQGPDGSPPATALYIYAADDWPAWQRAVRREATERYAARAVPALEPVTTPWPAWPWAVAFATAMLALWRRERR